jgi:hypothetical protein
MEALIVILCIIILVLVISCLYFAKESRPKVEEKIVIEVCQRLGDWRPDGEPTYHAQFRGSKAWAAGNTFYEAIGDLVNHSDVIDVKYLGLSR